MSTCNFHNVNSKYVRAINEDEFCVGDMFIQDLYDDYLQGVRDNLKRKGWSDRCYIDERDVHFLRSYEGSVIDAEISEEGTFYGIEYHVALTPVVRSGYYSGCNMDYEYSIDVSYGKTDDIEDLDDCFHYAGISTYRKNMFKRRIERVLQRLADKFEADIDEAAGTERYITIGPFSNGECGYRKVERVLKRQAV